MILYSVRHGETNCNLLNIANGILDEDLTAQGIFQAEELNKTLQDIDFNCIYSSPLKRALKTSQIIKPNKVIITDNRLIERDLGEFTNKLIDYEKRKQYWKYGNNCDYNMESLDSVFDRIYQFLGELEKKHENEKILLVSHQGICRIIDCYFNGIPKDPDLMKISFDNCEVRKYGRGKK